MCVFVSCPKLIRKQSPRSDRRPMTFQRRVSRKRNDGRFSQESKVVELGTDGHAPRARPSGNCENSGSTRVATPFLEVGQLREWIRTGQRKIVKVLLDANAFVGHGVTRGKRGSRSGKWIQNPALAKRQNPPYDSAKKRLRVSGSRMRGDTAFRLSAWCIEGRRTYFDQGAVTSPNGFPGCRTTKAACFPFSQFSGFDATMHAPVQLFPDRQATSVPRFPKTSNAASH